MIKYNYIILFFFMTPIFAIEQRIGVIGEMDLSGIISSDNSYTFYHATIYEPGSPNYWSLFCVYNNQLPALGYYAGIDYSLEFGSIAVTTAIMYHSFGFHLVDKYEVDSSIKESNANFTSSSLTFRIRPSLSFRIHKLFTIGMLLGIGYDYIFRSSYAYNAGDYNININTLSLINRNLIPVEIGILFKHSISKHLNLIYTIPFSIGAVELFNESKNKRFMYTARPIYVGISLSIDYQFHN